MIFEIDMAMPFSNITMWKQREFLKHLEMLILSLVKIEGEEVFSLYLEGIENYHCAERSRIKLVSNFPEKLDIAVAVLKSCKETEFRSLSKKTRHHLKGLKKLAMQLNTCFFLTQDNGCHFGIIFAIGKHLKIFEPEKKELVSSQATVYGRMVKIKKVWEFGHITFLLLEGQYLTISLPIKEAMRFRNAFGDYVKLEGEAFRREGGWKIKKFTLAEATLDVSMDEVSEAAEKIPVGKGKSGIWGAEDWDVFKERVKKKLNKKKSVS